MSTETVGFGDSIQLDPPSGRRTSGIHSYISLDAKALGSLRCELIERLGWAAARGLLERVGHESGRTEACRLRESYSHYSGGQRLRMIAQLSGLQGIVRVEVADPATTREQPGLFLAGRWHDSSEAEQHLERYGISSSPVCWVLAGYASGYASECLEEKISCLEVECRGKGDPACSFELRSAAAWEAAAVPAWDIAGERNSTRKFDRCFRSINELGCELERTSLDAVFTTNAEGFIASASQRARDLLCLMPESATEKKISSVLFGGNLELDQIMRRLLEEGRIHDHSTEVVGPGGLRTPIVLAASAIRDEAGVFVGTIWVAHDLTKTRRLEDELATKNRFMANILQDSADAILTLDPNDTVTSWNRGAEAIFGYSAAEVIGNSINILVPQELQEAQEMAKIGEKLRTQGSVRSHQTERITKDGRRIQVMFTRTAIRDDANRLIGCSAVLKDVTFFRNLERQLADAEHLATLGELSAGLAHEIKNPLAGIKGAIDVIRDSIPATNVHHEILGDVLHEVDRIDKIVKDLLNYAKPKPPSQGDINLPETAQRIVTMVRKSLKNESLSIEIEQRGRIPGFTGDETQLEQVLLNLLLNAQNAMPKGGHVTVCLSYDKKQAAIRIEVRDDGPGIPEEVRRKIFQPFFTTRTDGTGLGLAICLKNVQYHGGSIEFRTEMGQGTQFIVTIPLLCRI